MLNLDFFASAYFFGILLMGLSCVIFLTVFLPSWYEGYHRRFWITRLTYKDNNDQQSFVRFMWVFAWFLGFCGSFITSYNLGSIPHTFWWIFAQTCFEVILIWLMAKVIFAIIILLQYIWFGLLRIKNWIFNDKPLFLKK